jgi:hypothetical protein
MESFELLVTIFVINSITHELKKEKNDKEEKKRSSSSSSSRNSSSRRRRRKNAFQLVSVREYPGLRTFRDFIAPYFILLIQGVALYRTGKLSCNYSEITLSPK